MLAMAPQGAPQGVQLSSFQVKNTFIECNNDDMDDVMINNDFAKRQVSEPPPYTGKLLDVTSNKVPARYAFVSDEAGNGCIYESSEFSSIPGQSTTLDSLPEPEKESDPASYSYQAQDSQQSQTTNGYVAPAPVVPMQPMFTLGADAATQMANQMAVAALLAYSSAGAINQPQAWNNVRTVMVRNLPNKVNQATLISEI